MYAADPINYRNISDVKKIVIKELIFGIVSSDDPFCGLDDNSVSMAGEAIYNYMIKARTY